MTPAEVRRIVEDIVTVTHLRPWQVHILGRLVADCTSEDVADLEASLLRRDLADAIADRVEERA